MTPMRPPQWFDRQGMTAWCTGVAGLLRARVTIEDLEGVCLAEAGSGGNGSRRFSFRVNGQPAGWVSVSPGEIGAAHAAVVRQALEALERLADIRNSMGDLVRTTAHQWKELALLYKFMDTIAGALDPEVLAGHLAERACTVTNADAAAVCYEPVEPGGSPGCVAVGDAAEIAGSVARWALGLESGAIFSSAEDLAGSGAPVGNAGSVMAVPLQARGRNRGALAAVRTAGGGFSAEDLKLARLLSHQTALALSNLELVAQVRVTERMRRELEMAAEIQSSLLPEPLTVAGSITAAGICIPAQEVGGDVFMAIPSSGDLLTGVADVSGHGLSSALLMNAFASEIRALALTETSPGPLLDATNRLICERVGELGLFVTVVLIRCSDDGTLSIASAGHPPPLLLTHEGELEIVDTGGVPLGIMEDEAYEEVTLDGGRYNVIVMYSDGLTEARDAGGRMYGSDRLEQLLRELAPRHPGPREVQEAVLDDLRRFTGDVPQADDLTVLSVGRVS